MATGGFESGIQFPPLEPDPGAVAELPLNPAVPEDVIPSGIDFPFRNELKTAGWLGQGFPRSQQCKDQNDSGL